MNDKFKWRRVLVTPKQVNVPPVVGRLGLDGLNWMNAGPGGDHGDHNPCNNKIEGIK